MTDTREIARHHRDWLKRVVEISGIAPTTLARAAGLAATTLSKPLNDPDWSNALSAKTIKAVVDYTGIPGPDGEIPDGFQAPEAVPYVYEQPGSLNLDSALRAIIGKRNGVDPWVMSGRALDAAGILPGDIVIVDMNAEAEAGDVVVAQIYDGSGTNAETVFRIFQPPFLVSASGDRKQREVWLVDGRQAMIMGVVEYTLRGRTSTQSQPENCGPDGNQQAA